MSEEDYNLVIAERTITFQYSTKYGGIYLAERPSLEGIKAIGCSPQEALSNLIIAEEEYFMREYHAILS